VATDPSPSVVLTPLTGTPRPLEEWLTTFHLASVVLDPYTNESAWILNTAARVLRMFTGSAVRVNWVVTSGPDEAKQFLGPLANEFLTFCDPDRALVSSLGLTSLPAFVFVRIDGSVAACAEGWDPAEWKRVADAVAAATSWSSLHLPGPGDPGAYVGTPALA
jgi:hypothetical protein